MLQGPEPAVITGRCIDGWEGKWFLYSSTHRVTVAELEAYVSSPSKLIVAEFQ